MNSSRISGFYKRSIAGRIATLEKHGCLSSAQAEALRLGHHVMTAGVADGMTENVVGVFGLPLSIAPNFVVNGTDRLVPLVIEEPSVVAALSGAAALARDTGGFTVSCEESLLAGQIHLSGIADAGMSAKRLLAAREELQQLANAVHPRLQERGGGVRDIEVQSMDLASGAPLIVVNVFVDTCDAMGANLVNTICEAIAPRIAELSEGQIALRILSNLTDRSVFAASVSIAPAALATTEMKGDAVRDAIVLANDIALVDAHRAATHNKGIMNGIDALAIATGNDWRAIEAGAHAYAARNGHYRALTSWRRGDDGSLVGRLQVPLKVGIVGGTLTSNPAAVLGLSVCGVETAMELAELMAAVGLAQNFAAIRALATDGIQKGHMRLHARSQAAAARISATLQKEQPSLPDAASKAAGKIILLGEHAAVYGRLALAVPIPDALFAHAAPAERETTLKVQDWEMDLVVDRNSDKGIDGAINLILAELEFVSGHLEIVVRSHLPLGKGLGSSAAFAVAVTRAVAAQLDLSIDDERVNAIAFSCEQLAHGTPSGVDNMLSCFARPMLFRGGDNIEIQPLGSEVDAPLVIAIGHGSGRTNEMVAGVRSRRALALQQYETVFDQIEDLSREGASALVEKNYEKLGSLMNVCHGLLNAIGVSTVELENMVAIARSAGAAGAKLTGAGGGGAIVALCPDTQDQVRSALQEAGFRTLSLQE